jgi:hypothetical protein
MDPLEGSVKPGKVLDYVTLIWLSSVSRREPATHLRLDDAGGHRGKIWA